MILIIYYNCEKFERTYFIYFRKERIVINFLTSYTQTL